MIHLFTVTTQCLCSLLEVSWPCYQLAPSKKIITLNGRYGRASLVILPLKPTTLSDLRNNCHKLCFAIMWCQAEIKVVLYII
jgi:hypothetical protein